MNSFIKRFDIRWSDLDANRHVSNTAFLAFMNHTRMSFLKQNGLGHEDLRRLNIGPVIFDETFHYLKEVMPHEHIHVDIELVGLSVDYRFVRSGHSLFNSSGEQAVYSTITYCWFDLDKRKVLSEVPLLVKSVFDRMPRSENFSVLTKEDTRRLTHIPAKSLPAA